jgi:hypothetical protein
MDGEMDGSNGSFAFDRSDAIDRMPSMNASMNASMKDERIDERIDRSIDRSRVESNASMRERKMREMRWR